MKKPLIIGITGGIGGGKSTLSKVLRERGYYVYDSDIEAKKLQQQDSRIKQQLIECFGEHIYNENGLDRKTLAGIVFKNEELLAKLNNIVHPAVRENFLNWQKQHADQKILFIESAIMFESGLAESVDKKIVVTAPEKVRIARVMKRDKVTEDHVRARMARQLPEEEKIKRADIVLNSDGKRVLTQNVDKLLKDLNEIYRVDF